MPGCMTLINAQECFSRNLQVSFVSRNTPGSWDDMHYYGVTYELILAKSSLYSSYQADLPLREKYRFSMCQLDVPVICACTEYVLYGAVH